MSLYIEGLTMPATMAALIVIDNGEVCYKPLGNYGEKGEWRRLDKHAKELPPHGRLIDADALFPIYADLLDGGDVQAVVPKVTIDLAPTIIEAEGEE